MTPACSSPLSPSSPSSWLRVSVLLLGAGLIGVGLAGCAGGMGKSGKGSGRGKPASVSEVKGRTPAEIRSALGAPTLTRREPPAEVWQYSTESCVLDVVFYPPQNNPEGGLRAEWVGSRTLDGNASDPQACLKTISP